MHSGFGFNFGSTVSIITICMSIEQTKDAEGERESGKRIYMSADRWSPNQANQPRQSPRLPGATEQYVQWNESGPVGEREGPHLITWAKTQPANRTIPEVARCYRATGAVER